MWSWMDLGICEIVEVEGACANAVRVDIYHNYVSRLYSVEVTFLSCNLKVPGSSTDKIHNLGFGTKSIF